ncbi:hypothetical protein [Bacillus litorisediminis]|uniref:hypothetical protein n=1 Tax=Bacillus litorisediminis TaxID=2922713 RepID=UPI001FAFE83A|nr:hypothetical protein [Bacillus litorisediminis]
MPIDEKDLVRQPLMSTATNAPGYEKEPAQSKPANVPKIGDTIIGDEKNENKG